MDIIKCRDPDCHFYIHCMARINDPTIIGCNFLYAVQGKIPYVAVMVVHQIGEKRMTINWPKTMDNLKEAIKSAGLTQAEFAARVDVSPQTFNKYITGDNRPTVDTWEKIRKEIDFQIIYKRG